MSDELVHRGDLSERPGQGYPRRGRHRATIGGTLEIREAPESPTKGPGLDVAGHRLDVDDVADLADECERYLEERGRR